MIYICSMYKHIYIYMSMYIFLLCIHLHRFVLGIQVVQMATMEGALNCQASEPVALLKDPPGKRYLVFNGINYLHPGRLTWNIIIGVWKIIFLSKWLICRFHVNLPGCKLPTNWRRICGKSTEKPHLKEFGNSLSTQKVIWEGIG